MGPNAMWQKFLMGYTNDVLYIWVRESKAQYKFVYVYLYSNPNPYVSMFVNIIYRKSECKIKLMVHLFRYRGEGCGLTVEQTTEQRV